MKKLLYIILPFICSNLFGASISYHISNSGNDANNGTTLPFKTFAKAISVANAGDYILYNRGEVYSGGITITKSGTSSNPITIGAYGTGANPVITGFTNVTSWTNISPNIWESNALTTSITAENMVVINGVNTPIGRYPNSGWLTYQSAVSNTSITSNSLNAAVTNWTGAEAVIRVLRYQMKRSPITSASGGTLNYSGGGTDGNGGYGFFIQNDARTLDAQNEWYYNPATKKIRIYSASSPTNVNVSTVDNLLTINTFNYITVSNIEFQGANSNSILITSGQNNTIQSCNINYSGLSAIQGYPSPSFMTVDNCTINHSNNFAINAGTSNNITITGNVIKNTGIIPGAGSASGDYKGIHSAYNNTVIIGNTVDSTGYNAIEFDGDNSVAKNNFVSNYCLTLDDGGGIYVSPEFGATTYPQRTIQDNIVINAGSTPYLGADDTKPQTIGIYLDQLTPNVDVIGNTVFNTGIGILINNGHSINIDSNTVYNTNYSLYYSNYNAAITMSGLSAMHNIFVAKTSSQITNCWYFKTNPVTLPTDYTSDYNYFARPIDDNLSINLQTTLQNLGMWRTFSGQDVHTNKSILPVSNVNQIFTYINPTDHDSIGLNVVTGKSMDGTTYSGTTTLHAYSSLILIQTASLTPVDIAWTPAPLTYGTGLGAGQLDAVAKDGATTVTGTHTYSPGTATVGNVPGISVKDDFTPADPLTYSNATKTVTIPVSPQSVTLAFSNLTQTYDSLAHLPTLTATPNASTSILLDGVSGGKINAGTYTATGVVTDPNSTASPITATFTINKGTATINAVNTTVNRDGLNHSIPATTFPLGLNVTHTLSPVSALGTYTDTLRMVENNYTAAQIVRTLTIVANPALIFISDTLKTFDGTAQSVTVTSPYTYTLTNGTRTNAGTQQVIATINDGIHTGADTSYLTIAPKQAILSWNKPINAPYGTLFSNQQLNATADVPGSFTYNYSIGQIIPPGITTLTATFTPSSSNYVGGTITTTVQTYTEDQLLKFYLTNNFFLKQ